MDAKILFASPLFPANQLLDTAETGETSSLLPEQDELARPHPKELLPIQVDIEELQSPVSSIITKECIEAYSKIGGTFQHCVPFALLLARKHFRLQARSNPADAEENTARAAACEVLARKLVAATPMAEQYRILSARYTVIEDDGDESLPISVLELGVDQQATFFLSSSECQRCVFSLWRGLLVQIEKPNCSIEYVPYEAAKHKGGFLKRFDANRVGVPRYQYFFRIILWLIFIVAYTIAIQTPDRDFGLEDIVLYVQAVGYILEDFTKIYKIGSLSAFKFWTINLIIYALLGVAFGYRIADLSCSDAHRSEAFRRMSFQFLASAAPLIWMKMLTIFDLFQFFGTLQIVTFRMMKESAVFFTLLALMAIGFGQALSGLDVADASRDSTEIVIHSLVQGLLGSPVFDAYERGTDLTYPFGMILYYFWCLLTIVILLNILIALFGSAYQECTDEASAVFLGFFAGKTIAAIRAPDEFVYPAPANLIEVIILPLEFVLSKKQYATLNRYLMGVIFFVPICAIALYESHFDHRRQSDYAALTEEPDEYTDTEENPEVITEADDLGPADEEGASISKVPFADLKKLLPSLSRSVEGDILWEVKRLHKEIEAIKAAQEKK